MRTGFRRNNVPRPGPARHRHRLVLRLGPPTALDLHPREGFMLDGVDDLVAIGEFARALVCRPNASGATPPVDSSSHGGQFAVRLPVLLPGSVPRGQTDRHAARGGRAAR